MADDFARTLARVAAGQLAELAGYEAAQDSAVEILGELLVKYIRELSAGAHNYAEMANRSSMNVNDLLLAMDDLGTSVQELQTYLGSLTPDDNIFAHALPQFPVKKQPKLLPTFKDKQEVPPAHIPDFLPAFPDKHTYVRTPQFKGHEEKPEKQLQILQQGRKQAEKALVQLHYSLTRSAAGSQQPALAAAGADGDAAGQGADGAGAAGGSAGQANPFLSVPDFLQIAAPPGVKAAPPGESSGGPGGGEQGPGTSGAAGGSGGAFEPGAALKSFAAVLGPEHTDDGAGAGGQGPGRGAGEGGGADLMLADPDDLMGPEELLWKSEHRVDTATNALQPGLGVSSDYGVSAIAAARAAGAGRPEEDAFEAAAIAAAAAAGDRGAGRKRKSQYGVTDPIRRRAEEVLERAANPARPEDGAD